MEKVDREKFMVEIWKQYNATKDIEFLAKACEEAPFFGQKEMAFEIARILRSVKKKWKKIRKWWSRAIEGENKMVDDKVRL